MLLTCLSSTEEAAGSVGPVSRRWLAAVWHHLAKGLPLSPHPESQSKDHSRARRPPLLCVKPARLHSINPKLDLRSELKPFTSPWPLPKSEPRNAAALQPDQALVANPPTIRPPSSPEKIPTPPKYLPALVLYHLPPPQTGV
jgi:hypothetical protein